MKGDVISIEPEHRAAAKRIADFLEKQLDTQEEPTAITVAGESGSGKSETGHALAEEFETRGLQAFVFQQDDYFKLPPASNDRKRRQDPTWVGVNEVRLDLLDSHLRAAKERAPSVTKPLVNYDADQIEEDDVDLSHVDVVVAEGTYTTLLNEADLRVFIDRNRLQTLESRKKRGREPIDPFIESVLEKEHTIIAPHKERADIIITADFRVELPE
jgi:uridine kinase